MELHLWIDCSCFVSHAFVLPSEGSAGSLYRLMRSLGANSKAVHHTAIQDMFMQYKARESSLHHKQAMLRYQNDGLQESNDWLNEEAPENISVICSTRLTFHADNG